MRDKEVIQPGRITARHIVHGVSTEPKAVDVLGTWFVPQDRRGINGRRGFAAGQYELRLKEEGTFTLTVPNGAGADGQLHRERFLIIREGRRMPAAGDATIYEGGDYAPGDEWIEGYREGLGPPLYVCTPTRASVTRDRIVLSGYCAFWTLRKQREYGAGFWAHAPRDVIEHYASKWGVETAEGFDDLVFSYSSSVQTTGGWSYQRAESITAGEARLRTGTSLNTPATIHPTAGFPIGLGSGEPHRVWRMEADFSRSGLETGNYIIVGLHDESAGAGVYISLYGTATVIQAQGVPNKNVKMDTEPPGPFRVAIEGRGRWVFYYLDGRLLGVLPMPAGTLNVVGWLAAANPGTASEIRVDARSLIIRRTERYLLRSADVGDYHLPGAFPPGGLTGEYFIDTDLATETGIAATWERHILNPLREPYARRQDATINFAEATPPAWQPVGPPSGEQFSVRWMGAIYLDLENYDFRVRTRANDRARVWIGKTRMGEQLIDDWTNAGHALTTTTSGQLRTALGLISGWYPIRIEYSQGAGAGGMIFEWERSDAVGTWTVVPADKLSRLGIYQAQVRNESFYDALRAAADSAGLQYTCEPQSLESGLFPGELVPRTRVGRDTAYVLGLKEGIEIGTEINAEETAHSLIADAAGIADPEQGAQLTAEAIDFARVDSHFMMLQEYESLSDITSPDLLAQRLAELLTIKGSAWEEVSARPEGFKKLVDSFPLSGELAEFAWLPGDALRLDLPDIGVVDQSPRQLLGIVRPFVPAGLQRPNAAFRQRPRNFRETLRRILKSFLVQARNYQGQIITLNGSIGSNLASWGTDGVSRVPLPPNVGKIVKATVVVLHKTNTTAWDLGISGTIVRPDVTKVATYDVTGWAQRVTPNDSQMMWAYLTAKGGSTGNYILQLSLQVALL